MVDYLFGNTEIEECRLPGIRIIYFYEMKWKWGKLYFFNVNSIIKLGAPLVLFCYFLFQLLTSFTTALLVISSNFLMKCFHYFKNE